MIVIYYQDGRQWVLGSDSRFEQDQYLEAMIAPDLESKPDEYDFVYSRIHNRRPETIAELRS